MADGEYQLPDGWNWTSVNTIGEVVTGTTPSKANENYYGNHFPFYKPTDLDAGFFTKNSRDGLSSLGIQKARLLPEKSILVTTIGKTGLIRTPGASNQQINAIIPNKSIIPEYLYYICVSPFFQKAIQNSASATTLPILNKSKFEKLLIPLAPLSEQAQIVAKIEELFTQLDAGTSALAKVQAGLRRYKRSVLKAAVEGRLVDGNLVIGEGRLPVGWRIARIEELADTIGGVTKGRNFRGKKTVMLPYLRVANVQRGRLDLEEMKEIELLEIEVEKYRLRDGDVVLTEGGDWDKLGRSAVWRKQIELCVHQNHIFRARVKESAILPEWLMYFTNSEVGQDYFKEAAKQTTNLASVNLTQLRNCPVYLPPLEEQRRIVAEVERRLSVARQVESSVEEALVRASRLRQAMLRSAFEGRLT
jgi:type I restriction enzyme, S subunit